jgi:predicted O-linked N-acetylglucosamine transferase (SPINDLY family)
LALEMGNPAHLLVLANALHHQERWEAAADVYRQALAGNPNEATAWLNLAAVEHRLGRLDEAEAAYERGLSLAPGEVDGRVRYATLLVRRGRAQEAVGLLKPVVAHVPSLGVAWHVLGDAYNTLQDWQQALEALRRAAELVPGNRKVRLDLAGVLLAAWELTEGEQCIRKLIEEDPQDAAAWSLLGTIQQSRGEAREGLHSIRRAAELVPAAINESRAQGAMQYVEGVRPEELLEAHRRWDGVFGAEVGGVGGQKSEVRGQRSEDGGQRTEVRIGFLSGDFAHHPVAFTVLPLLEHLDRARCFVACYSDGSREDEYTARFRAAAKLWRDTSGLADEELCKLVQDDALDVLVDLTGHFGARMGVFARRAAPVQMSWFGYVGTTGLAAMDFLLADRFHVPAGEEVHYSETVLRMPHGYICYEPPVGVSEVSPLPALETGRFTLGCFNNPVKYSPGILDAWSEILRRLPEARLLLKYGWLGKPSMQEWFHRQFSQRGIEAERVLIEGQSPHLEHLANYSRVDLALDTQPYSGGVTTCEALWMGVPVITCAGRTFAGRHATSHLVNAGYEQFVARDLTDYIEHAVEWAGRMEELAAIRKGMREQFNKSPLGDAAAFASDFMNLVEPAVRSKRGTG